VVLGFFIALMGWAEGQRLPFIRDLYINLIMLLGIIMVIVGIFILEKNENKRNNKKTISKK